MQAEEVECIKIQEKKKEEIKTLEHELQKRKALGTYDSDDEDNEKKGSKLE